jgi:hypothetical protein
MTKNKLRKYRFGAIIAALAVAGVATPALAKKKQHPPRHGYQEPYVASGPFADPRAFGFYRDSSGIWRSSTGSVVPSYVVSTPEKCWVEDGYNRWSPCDAAAPR